MKAVDDAGLRQTSAANANSVQASATTPGGVPQGLSKSGTFVVRVAPGSPHLSFAVDQKCRPLRDVFHPTVILSCVESADRLAVPVGEEAEREVERLHPGDVRPGGVARDPERLDAERFELLAPVTQELHLVRSRRGPVEEVEEQQNGTVGDDLRNRVLLARPDPDGRVGDPVADGEHQPPGDADDEAVVIGRPRSACCRGGQWFAHAVGISKRPQHLAGRAVDHVEVICGSAVKPYPAISVVFEQDEVAGVRDLRGAAPEQLPLLDVDRIEVAVQPVARLRVRVVRGLDVEDPPRGRLREPRRPARR